jgi:hypothetical protein
LAHERRSAKIPFVPSPVVSIMMRCGGVGMAYNPLDSRRFGQAAGFAAGAAFATIVQQPQEPT